MGTWIFIQYIAAGSFSLIVYRYGLLRLLEKPVAAKVLRVLAVQSALITLLIGAVLEGVHGELWELTLEILLFFCIGNGSTRTTSTIKMEKFPRTFL
jgi:hypothetical protein